MAKTLSITIPDELHERLIRLKKSLSEDNFSDSYKEYTKEARKALNVSKICQKAIAEAVETTEQTHKEEVLKWTQSLKDQIDADLKLYEKHFGKDKELQKRIKGKKGK